MASPDHPIIIGLVGDSGAGKTTFAAGLEQILGTDQTLTICIDDYHKFSRQQRAAMDITPHDPECNYIDILEQHVQLLREGQPILKPVYNHNGGVLEPPVYVQPRRFIILEGLMGFMTPQLRDAYDVKLYLEPHKHLRQRWKFQRDIGWGGYTMEQVMASLERINRDTTLFIVPQRSYADMVISFYPPDSDPDEHGANLNVRHILRPTLPYLDLAPLLEVGADKGLMLELARDIDGRPVDALHVLGGQDPDRTEAMEEFLWSLLPDYSRPMPPLGVYSEKPGQEAISPPLAISQLLVTHYLLKTALNDHAL